MNTPRLTSPVIYCIGMLQFILLAMGLMVLHIIVKINPTPDRATPFAQFLLDKGIFFLLIPILWDILARLVTRKEKTWIPEGVVQTAGLTIAALIGGVFITLIVRWIY